MPVPINQLIEQDELPELVDVSSPLVHGELPSDTSAPPNSPLVEHSELPNRTVESQVDQPMPLLLDLVSTPLVDESEPLAGVEQTTVESVEIEDVEVVGDRPPLEDAVDTATSALEPVEETVVENASVTPAKIEKPVRSRQKSGKKLPGATKKLVEKNLLPGQKVKAKKLAELIQVTAPGIRHCRDTKKLHEWGLELVPDSDPQLFQRIPLQ